MTLLFLVLGIANIFLAGQHWGLIRVNNVDGVKNTEWNYAWTVLNFVVGIYMLVSAIGHGSLI